MSENHLISGLCSSFLNNWEAAPETEKDIIFGTFIQAVSNTSEYSDADIAAVESTINICQESILRSELVLSEADEKGLAVFCLRAAKINEQSNLITSLGRLFRRTAEFVNDQLIQQDLPFVLLDGMVRRIPPAHRPYIIRKPPFLFLDQCCDYQHRDFSWEEKDYDQVTRQMTLNHKFIKDRCHAKYVHIIAPDKQSVYDDICPTDIPGYNQQIQLVAQAMERAGVRVVHPIKRLKEGRAVRNTYYYTNSHWTDYGAYLGYLAVMEQLQKAIDIPIVQPGEFYYVEKRGIEDLGGRLVPPCWEIRNSPKFKNEDIITDKRSAKFNQRNAWRIYENSNDQLPVAVAFHDSFFNTMAPFFARSFSKIISIPAKVGTISTDLLEKFHPDVVLSESVERLTALCAWQNRDSFDIKMDDIDPDFAQYIQKADINTSSSTYDRDVFDMIANTIRMQFSTNIAIYDNTTAFDVDGWDSLEHVTLLLLLESKIGFTFDDTIRFGSATVGELATNISKARKLRA